MNQKQIYPNSYKDQFWSDLSGSVERELSIPSGLLQSIVMHGERSNANQVSEKGAKTPFQIIPSTRNAILKNYGVDAYQSPKEAAKAAGIILKESLDRNNGDVVSAIAEYHGGTNKQNWGDKTNAYTNRVYEGFMKSSPQEQQEYAPTISEGGQISTFRSALSNTGSQQSSVSGLDPNVVQKLYAAYSSGQMTPDEAKEFEADVRAGVIPGSDNMSTSGETILPMAQPLPISVIQAYQSGQMTPQEVSDLEYDIQSGAVYIPQQTQNTQDAQTAPAQETPEMQTPTTIEKIKDVFTGNLRETETTRSLKDWAAMPELNSFSLSGLKTGLGTLMSNPEETVQVIQANFPNVGVRQDEKGNFILRSSVDGQEYAIKPGFQVSDIPRAAASIASFTPAGRATTIPRAIAAGAGTQAGIEASQSTTGGSFDLGEIATSGALGGTASLLSRGIGAASQKIKSMFPGSQAEVSQASVATKPSLDVASELTLSGEDLAKTAKKAASGGVGSSAAKDVLSQQAAPDQKVIEAAKRLGIQDYLQPDHVTSNQAYRELTQAIKSIPGSASRSSEIQGLEAVGRRANDLIEEIGGTTDMSQLNQNIRSRFETSISELEKEARNRFDALKKSIPAQSRSVPENIIGFVRQRAKDLNGYQNLSSLEKEIIKKLSPRVQKSKTGEVIGEVGPTYALIDDVRRDIGAATRGKGPFADSDIGRANELYALIRKDQGNIVEQFGKGDEYKLANQVVVMRKGLEDDMQALFGKQIDQSIVGKLTSATKALPQGDAQKFVNIIKAIPPEMRQHVVASSLNAAFGRATRDGALNFNSFAQWYDGILKNKQAYTALMSNLPPSSRKKISDLYRVSKNISLATRERISTGRIQAVKDEFQDPDTAIARLYEIAKRASVGVPIEAFTTSIGVPGAGIASGIAAALTRSSSKAIDAADKLLASPEFQKMIANPTKKNIKQMSKNKNFIAFYNTINAKKTMSSVEQLALKLTQSSDQSNDKSNEM